MALTDYLPPPPATAATPATAPTATKGDWTLTDRLTGQITDAVPVLVVPSVGHTTPSATIKRRHLAGGLTDHGSTTLTYRGPAASTATEGDRALANRLTGQIADAVVVQVIPGERYPTLAAAIDHWRLILLRRFLGLYGGE